MSYDLPEEKPAKRIILLPHRRSVAVCKALRMQPPPILISEYRHGKRYDFRMPI